MKLSVLSSAGKEAIVAILGPGDFFGEGCLAGQKFRMGSAAAITPSAVLFVDIVGFSRLVRETSPDEAIAVFAEHVPDGLGRPIGRRDEDRLDEGDVEGLPFARRFFGSDARRDAAVDRAHVVRVTGFAVGVEHLHFVDATQVDSAVAALGDVDLERELEVFELAIGAQVSIIRPGRETALRRLVGGLAFGQRCRVV